MGSRRYPRSSCMPWIRCTAETMSEAEADRLRDTRAAGRATYLIPLLLLPVGYRFLVSLLPGRSLLGWDVALLLLMIGFAVTIALWLPYRTDRTWPVVMRAWLLSFVLLWLYLVVISQVHDADGHWGAVVVPIGLMLVYLRPPARSDVWRAGDVFAWAVLVTGFVHVVLEATGVIPSWYRVLGGTFLDLSSYDRDTHWLPVGSLLGLEGRWGGILQDPNLIGPLGLLLVLYGFARSGWNRVGLVLGGLMAVVLADSRASYGALAIGLIVLAALPGWPARAWLGARGAALAVGALCLVRLGITVEADPAGAVGMTGRTDMWGDFLPLLDSSPWTGIGTTGIVAAHDAGLLPPWTYHGHNQFLDGLVRYGWVGAILIAVVLALLAVLAIQAAWRRCPLPVALLLAFLVVSAANVIVDWRYPNVLTGVLLLVGLIAATAED